MIAFTLRRMFQMIPTLLGVALVTFIVFHIAGGDPILMLAGKHATPEQIETLRHEYGFDLSLPQQFLRFVKQITTFQFERSFQTKQTIGKMLLDGMGASLSLAIPAFLFGEAASIALALLAAFHRRKWMDHFIVVSSIVGMSVSILAFILLGQYFLAFHYGLFPISGYEPSWTERWSFLALPWIIWVVASVGSDIRFYRTLFLEELGKDYVRTAKAKGVSRTRILFGHVFRNTYVQVITRCVIAIPFLFTGSLLLENFFGIPGLGSMTVDAFNNADWPVVKAITILGSMLYVLFNLLSDLLYAVADPRVELR